MSGCVSFLIYVPVFSAACCSVLFDFSLVNDILQRKGIIAEDEEALRSECLIWLVMELQQWILRMLWNTLFVIVDYIVG